MKWAIVPPEIRVQNSFTLKAYFLIIFVFNQKLKREQFIVKLSDIYVKHSTKWQAGKFGQLVILENTLRSCGTPTTTLTVVWTFNTKNIT